MKKVLVQSGKGKGDAMRYGIQPATSDITNDSKFKAKMLGNLTLLSGNGNRRVSNKPFSEKNKHIAILTY